MAKQIATLDELVEVTNNNKKVVVKFWADWCQPCKKLAPHFEKAAEKTDAAFVEVDIENCDKSVLEAYSIQSVPTLIYINMDRYEVVTLQGRTSLQILKEIGE